MIAAESDDGVDKFLGQNDIAISIAFVYIYAHVILLISTRGDLIKCPISPSGVLSPHILSFRKVQFRDKLFRLQVLNLRKCKKEENICDETHEQKT